MNKSKEIERLILEGVEAKDIRDTVGCCISLVYAVADRKGLTVKRSSATTPRLEQHHEEVQRDIYNGYTIIAIAKKYKVSHVIPLSKGGEHSWGNVKLAHRICNSKKSNR